MCKQVNNREAQHHKQGDNHGQAVGARPQGSYHTTQQLSCMYQHHTYSVVRETSDTTTSHLESGLHSAGDISKSTKRKHAILHVVDDMVQHSPQSEGIPEGEPMMRRVLSGHTSKRKQGNTVCKQVNNREAQHHKLGDNHGQAVGARPQGSYHTTQQLSCMYQHHTYSVVRETSDTTTSNWESGQCSSVLPSSCQQ